MVESGPLPLCVGTAPCPRLANSEPRTAPAHTRLASQLAVTLRVSTPQL